MNKDKQTYNNAQPFRQKVNIELLRWGTTSGKMAPLRDFLMVRLLMTKQRTCVLPKKKILEFLTWSRLYRVQEFGFLKIEKGNVWLVGASKIEAKLNIPSGKYVFLSLDNLRNLVRTTIEVFAVHVQRTRKYMEEKWHGQKTYVQRGASGRLLARILKLDIHTIYRHKDKRNWSKGKCTPVNKMGRIKDIGHFKTGFGLIMYQVEDRCNSAFDFFFDAVEKVKEAESFNFDLFLSGGVSV